MKIIVLFLSSCLIFPISIRSQNCYQDYLQRGIQAYDNLDFESALNLFNAAKICPDITEEQTEEITEWHDKASTGYIDAIKKARDEAIQAQEEAEMAQADAENQARLTEANRRAYLATQELENRNWNDALLLAYSARDMVGLDELPIVDRAYGEVVAQSLSIQLEPDESRQLEFGLLSDGTIWGISDDGFVRFWGKDGKLEKKIGESGESVLKLCISPDESRFLLLYKTPLAKLWSREGNTSVPIDLDQPVSTATFTKEGKQVLAGSRDGHVRLCDLSGKTLYESSLHDAPVYQARFLPDGTSIIARSGDQTVRLLDDRVQIASEVKHEKHIYTVDISPDQEHLLTASADHTAGLWDMNGNVVVKLTHPDIVYNAVFSPSGNEIWTTSLDGFLRKWSKDGNQMVALKHQARISNLQFSTGGDHILTTCGSQAMVWGNMGEQICSVQHDSEIRGASFAPGGDHFLTYSDTRVRLWDFSGKMVMEITRFDRLELSKIDDESGSVSVEINPGGIRQSMFSKDGSSLFTLSGEGEIYNTRNPEHVFAELKANPPEISQEQKEKYGL